MKDAILPVICNYFESPFSQWYGCEKKGDRIEDSDVTIDFDFSSAVAEGENRGSRDPVV